MTQVLQVHPDNPQLRLLRRAVNILEEGGVIVYPTDSAYALGCNIGDKDALETIRRIRKLDKEHNFTLVCKDLSELSTYARVDNSIYRLLKAYTPGPYTFILPATKEVPKRLQHPKRKTIGLRIPDNQIVLDLLAELGNPILSVTLVLPNETTPLSDIDDIYDKLNNQVDLIIDGGYCGITPTTVVDCSQGIPKILRAGKGETAPFE